MNWLTYLLVCADGTYYCGITNDLQNRLRAHNSGKGAKYTRGRLPVKLKAIHGGLTRSQAAKLEYAVKKVPRERKLEVLRDWRCGIVAIPADCKSVLLRGFGGSSPPVATSFTVREH